MNETKEHAHAAVEQQDIPRAGQAKNAKHTCRYSTPHVTDKTAVNNPTRNSRNCHDPSYKSTLYARENGHMVRSSIHVQIYVTTSQEHDPVVKCSFSARSVFCEGDDACLLVAVV